MKRNPDILIHIDDMFSGSLMAFEESFGYYTEYSDEDLLSYIKSSWMKDNNCELILVMNKFEDTYWSKLIPSLDYQVLIHMKNYYSQNQGFPHPSYVNEIISALNAEIQNRGH